MIEAGTDFALLPRFARQLMPFSQVPDIIANVVTLLTFAAMAWLFRATIQALVAIRSAPGPDAPSGHDRDLVRVIGAGIGGIGVLIIATTGAQSFGIPIPSLAAGLGIGGLLRSLVSVLVVVPLAAFVLVATLPVPPEVALGLVLLAAAPGAPLTTRRSQMAGADQGYVSALQLILAALAVVFMPSAIAAFGTVLDPSVPIPAPGKVARQVAVVTILPVTLGWLFARLAPGILRRRAPLLSRAAKLLFVAFALVVVLALAFVPELRASILIGWAGAAALASMAGGALAAGHLLGGPGAARRGGLATASVARNLGLALFIAESAPETVDAIPTILTYALLGILLAVPYSLWIKGRAAVPG